MVHFLVPRASVTQSLKSPLVTTALVDLATAVPSGMTGVAGLQVPILTLVLSPLAEPSEVTVAVYVIPAIFTATLSPFTNVSVARRVSWPGAVLTTPFMT